MSLPLNVGNVLKVAIEDLIGQRSFKSERHFYIKKVKGKEKKKKKKNTSKRLVFLFSEKKIFSVTSSLVSIGQATDSGSLISLMIR
jgi:hypothetical protein